MKAKPLNEFTRQELEAAQKAELSKREKKACAWCRQEVQMRNRQRFCCDHCRASYGNFAREAGREKLIEYYENSIKELQSEIEGLKAELSRRDTPTE